MTEDYNESRSNRLAAETFMPIMVEAFHDGLHEVASLSRWLLATLVAINGAAVISVLPLKMAHEAKLGGTLAFLWLNSGADARPLCEKFAKAGVLIAPGDCYGMPSYLRIGFGACEPADFEEALSIMSRILSS